MSKSLLEELQWQIQDLESKRDDDELTEDEEDELDNLYHKINHYGQFS